MMTIKELEKEAIPEAVAIVLICRVFLKTATRDELTTFLAGLEINWELFYEIARAHHIRPIVNNVLSDTQINEAVSSRLQADCKQIALRNFENYRELLRLNNLLKAAGIVAVPYKGCVFSLQFYDDVSLREFSDLDLLFRPGIPDVRAIATVMEKEGYTATYDAPEEFEEFYFSHIREFKFVFTVNGQRKFLAEFHSLLNDPVFETATPIANEYLFTDLVEETLSGNNIKLLSPAKHFIAMLTHHGIREQWSSLKNIIDLAQVLKQKEKIDWDAIFEDSRKYRFKKVLTIGLNMAEEVLGVNLSRQHEKINTTPWLKNLFSKHLYKTDRTWRYNFSLKLASKDSVADKWAILWRHFKYMATPSILDYKFIKLPKGLFFLYVFVKPVRMMRGKTP